MTRTEAPPLAETQDQPTAKSGQRGNFFTEWVVPIVLGVAIGWGGLQLYRYVAHSKAWDVVQQWNADAEDANEKVAKDLQKLGSGAREDLHSVLRDPPEDSLDVRIWVAHQLAGEPWFDTQGLKDVLKDGKASVAVRRAVACALVDTQHKEVDTELVLPVFEEWMNDLQTVDHTVAALRVAHMQRSGMLSPQWESKFRKSMVRVCDRATRQADPPKRDLLEHVDADRAGVLLEIGVFLPDDELVKSLWTAAKDETDDEGVRVAAVRTLADGSVLDAKDVPDWQAVAASKNDTVRQTVADNLGKAREPAFDKVLTPLQFDASPLARAGAIDSQITRRRSTMFERFDELMQDGDEWVRFNAMYAAGVFKSVSEGAPARAAMILEALEKSDDPVDVEAAALALKMLTDQVYGFKPDEVRVNERQVDETALRTFMADKNGRKSAADKWRSHFGPAAVWTDTDRRKALEKLLQHADPRNVERAKLELAKPK
jgi:hypothetical protein